MDVYDLAFVDRVSGLRSRNFFETCLRRRYLVAQDLGALFLELDFFKEYGDLFGTHQGDSALSAIGARLKKMHHDRICRYGDERFLAFVENCDGQLRDWAEDTREAISSTTIPLSTYARIPCHELYPMLTKITASIGAAKRRPHEPLDSLIARADAQLCLARRQRDSVVVEV
jgi:diguanylate cyclase (GGDEF)-like protein